VILINTPNLNQQSFNNGRTENKKERSKRKKVFGWGKGLKEAGG